MLTTARAAAPAARIFFFALTAVMVDIFLVVAPVRAVGRRILEKTIFEYNLWVVKSCSRKEYVNAVSVGGVGGREALQLYYCEQA